MFISVSEHISGNGAFKLRHFGVLFFILKPRPIKLYTFLHPLTSSKDIKV